MPHVEITRYTNREGRRLCCKIDYDRNTIEVTDLGPEEDEEKEEGTHDPLRCLQARDT